MAKFRINAKFRELLSEKLMDLGNLIFTGTVIGQFISGLELSLPVMLGGLLVAVICYILSFIILHNII
jgi:hypothetical protein